MSKLGFALLCVPGLVASAFVGDVLVVAIYAALAVALGLIYFRLVDRSSESLSTELGRVFDREARRQQRGVRD